MKKVHTDPDAEVIALANKPGQERVAEQVYLDARRHRSQARKEKFQKARAKFFKAVAAMEICILGVLLSVAALLSEWVSPVAAVVMVIVFATGGGTVGRKIREGQWYGCE